MKHYDHSKQEDRLEIEDLVHHMPVCLLLTFSKQQIQTGIFNPILQEGRLFFHLNRSDEQFKTILQTSRARAVFLDYLCNIPSYWVDEQYGGAATSYYRFADFDCAARTYTQADEIAKICQMLLDRYQPECGYAPLDSPIYHKSFATLGIVELTPHQVIGKWKLGQNRPVEKRREIVEKLKQRNQGQDWRAAQEIEKWLQKHN